MAFVTFYQTGLAHWEFLLLVAVLAEIVVHGNLAQTVFEHWAVHLLEGGN